MEDIFLSIYYFFKQRRLVFWSVFVFILTLLATGASQIKIEEDITRFFPDDERVEKLNYVFKNAKFAERLIFMVSVKDTATAPEPDSLIAFTEEIVTSINSQLSSYVSSINDRVDDSKVLDLIDAVQMNLPIFLDEKDYEELDSIIKPENLVKTLNSNYRQLISPSGFITKKIIANDPLGFSFIVLKKLQQLQYDKNVDVYDNYLISKDHRHLVFFIQPLYKSFETGLNAPFIAGLNDIIVDVSDRHPQLKASYFGATAVASGNARQLQQDTILTVSLMLILLAVFIIGFFKKKRVPFLILIPVVFGGLFSLCFVYLIQGHISILAIAAGSIILGIAVNYSLHFLSHLKHIQDIPTVIKDLVKPMTLGSTTTVLAFLSLQFVNAAVLQDVGLFAGFSLIGAALCSLIFLPHFISASLFKKNHKNNSWIEKLSSVAFESNKSLLLVIFILTPFFLYFATKVSFNTDMRQLNFMSKDLHEAQQRLEFINKASMSAMYVVAQDKSFEKALRKNENIVVLLDQLQRVGLVQKYSTVSSFLISDSLQQIRISKWNAFWTKEKVRTVTSTVRQEGARLKFSEKVFQNFEKMLLQNYAPAASSFWQVFRQAFFGEYIIEKDGLTTIISMANVALENKEKVYRHLQHSASAFDRLMLTNLFVEYVHADFNFIVAFTSLFVFAALLLSYGRIELALITFMPMLFTWVWILGIMALVGIEFNIVNVMISTFIFGLGDDYSIFTMDGLQQEHKLGLKNLSSIRSSILLSALTTISGLGVLMLAKHPALRSIAGISIIGITCVFFMSQTIEPFLFRWLITNRTSKGIAPITLWGLFRSGSLYVFFIAGSIILTIIGLLLWLIPGKREKTRMLYHKLISSYIRALVHMDPSIKVHIIGSNPAMFKHPVVMISNHTSFLDILFTLMLHPKLILLTNKWVWNSPIFGGVVRLADYYPVMEGVKDNSILKLGDRIKEGYSVVIFPEGTRSTDGKIKRFHKGAFYIAELFNLPVQPLIIHGAGDALPKHQFYIEKGNVTLNFLPLIEQTNTAFGVTYAERTKSISKYFKDEYRSLELKLLTPRYFAQRLLTNYLYKGPVLEWYMRIKLKLEGYYEPFHKLIPLKANILDLGCGYGFLDYMLCFLSRDRQITGVDFDAEKIEVANHCYSKTVHLNFVQADITQFPLAKYDVIIIADVLHYLTPECQELLIKNCFKALNPKGRLIIREGNTDMNARHKGTKLSEFFSVKVLKFNKAVNALHFLSGEKLTKMAEQHGFKVEVVDETRFTSNIIFVIS